MLIAVKLNINDQRAFINCVKAGRGKIQDALGALWVSCPSRGSGGMGASQKFLVSSLGRTNFRKLKVEPLVGAPWNGCKPEISRELTRKDRF